MLKKFSLLMSLCGMILFTIGFHNVDMSFNLVNIGVKGYDYSLGGVKLTLEESYVSGLKMMWAGIFMVLTSTLLLVFIPSTVYTDKR